jgi:hypothetical protein
LFGLFKDYFANRKEKSIESAGATIRRKIAIKDERMAAIESMARLGDAEVAIPHLLARFDYSLEHGIQDEREKNRAMDGILGYGENAVSIVRRHLVEKHRIAWPIKILSKLKEQDFIVDALKECLDFGDTSFNMNALEKNYDVLCYLRDYPLPGYKDKLAHFLKDPDERIRFAAVEALAEQDDESINELFEPFLSDESSDNRRIREVVVNAFVDKSWKVKDRELFMDGYVIPGVRIQKDGSVLRSK